MHYYPDDVQRLLSAAPFRFLWRKNNFSQFIRNLADLAREHGKILALYPHVKCEYLDSYYVFLQSLGAADSFLIEDLLTHNHYWAWGCLLSMFNPQYRSLLNEHLPQYKESEWLLNLTYDLYDEKENHEFFLELGAIKYIRHVIKPLALPQIHLRHNAQTPQDFRHFTEYQKNIREIYIQYGASYTAQYIKNNPLNETALDYRDWHEKIRSIKN